MEQPERTGLEKRLDQITEQVNDLRSRKRSLTFREAGIDLSTGIGRAINDVYDGPADPEELRTFATRYGIGVEDNDESNDHE